MAAHAVARAWPPLPRISFRWREIQHPSALWRVRTNWHESCENAVSVAILGTKPPTSLKFGKEVSMTVAPDGLKKIKGLRANVEALPIDPKIKKLHIRDNPSGLGVRTGWLAHLFAKMKGLSNGRDSVVIGAQEF
jgi:hypothetical protein